jgi:YHS domain-containing protein
MDIDPAAAAGTSVYQETTYYFCSMGCKHDFDEDPEGVLKAEAEHDHGQPMDHGMMEPGQAMDRGMAMSEPVAAGSGMGEKKRPWWKFWG